MSDRNRDPNHRNPPDPDNEMEKLISEMKAKLTSNQEEASTSISPSFSILDMIELLLGLELSCLQFARESLHHANIHTTSEGSIDLLESIALRTSLYVRTRLGLPKGEIPS